MNTYDQLALSQNPLFYLASPSISDQSGRGLFTIGVNDATTTGQSIIVGHSNSIRVNNDQQISISGSGNLFVPGTTIEFVLFINKPQEDTPIFFDPVSGTGIYATQNGFDLRLYFTFWGVTTPIIQQIDIKDWAKKYYIRVLFSSSQAEFYVNDFSASIEYKGEPISSIANVKIGLDTLPSGFFLIDGFGIYDAPLINKSSNIDDSNGGHSFYSSRVYGGNTTLFDGIQPTFTTKFSYSDFVFYDEIGIEKYFYVQVPVVDDEFSFISIRSADERVQLQYRVNQGSWIDFDSYAFFIPSTKQPLISFRKNGSGVEEINDFEITVEGYYQANVVFNTPANLVLEQTALYPSRTDESIVNCPDGVFLPGSRYEGTWIPNGIMEIPKSVEVIFKAYSLSNKTYVFSSNDGSASYGPTGSIENYTAYLNGQLVTDLTSVQVGQWYQLILVDATPTANQFYLNYDSVDQDSFDISYLSLTAYPNEITQAQANRLYEILVGADSITFNEPLAIISEGITETGTAYLPYSYSWAIVGAGGH